MVLEWRIECLNLQDCCAYYSLTDDVISVWSLLYPPIEAVIPVTEPTCVVERRVT